MAKTTPLTHEELLIALPALGFDSGWVLEGNTIAVWDRSEPQPTEDQLRAAL